MIAYRCNQVLACSAFTGFNITTVWDTALQYKATMLENGELLARRASQRHQWLWTLVKEKLIEHFMEDSEVRKELQNLESQVISGNISAGTAADMLCDSFIHGRYKASES